MAEPEVKKKKKLWNQKDMKRAIESVKEGGKIKTAARNFNVPESTLRDRLKLGEEDPHIGRKAVFSPEEEQELCEYVGLLAKRFYGLTQKQLRTLAYEFAEQKGIKHNFSSEKKLAGKCWVYAFLKRNQGISLRLPEPTSLNRILGFNKSAISIFFTNLEMLMAKHAFQANRIFNVDETGISTVQKACKIYAPKGMKQVGIATSGERGQNVTVVCAFSATGIYVPPMFIFPRMRIKLSLSAGGPAEAAYECSKSGWINEDLFLKWLKHFAKYVSADVQRPVLLILDNHSSHQSLQAYNFCRDNGIHLLSLPPHTSHRMQPLDVTFYGPLKSAYARECDLHMKSHHFEKITHDNLAFIFNKAYTRVATMEKAVRGFDVTGIYPLNPHIFDEDDDQISDPIPQVLPTSNSETSTTRPSTSRAGPSTSRQAAECEQRESTINSQLVESQLIDYDDSTRSFTPSPSVLEQDVLNTSYHDAIMREKTQSPNRFNQPLLQSVSFPQPSCSSKSPVQEAVIEQPCFPQDHTIPTSRKSSRNILEELSPVPQKIFRSKRSVKQQHSSVLTATPLKEELEDKDRKRKIKEMKSQEKQRNVKGKQLDKENSTKTSRKTKNVKNEKKSRRYKGKHVKGKMLAKRKSVKRKILTTDSEESDEDIPLAMLCNDDEDDDVEEEDLCAVCGEFGRSGELWFRCCSCSNWIHKECSGKSSPDDFICGFCNSQ